VGLVLPAAAQRRQSGMGANRNVTTVNTEPPPGRTWRRFARCRYSRRSAALSSLPYGHHARGNQRRAIGKRFKITTRARLSTWRSTPMRVGRT
jgi:hypothetical protein